MKRNIFNKNAEIQNQPSEESEAAGSESDHHGGEEGDDKVEGGVVGGGGRGEVGGAGGRRQGEGQVGVAVVAEGAAAAHVAVPELPGVLALEGPASGHQVLRLQALVAGPGAAILGPLDRRTTGSSLTRVTLILGN